MFIMRTRVNEVHTHIKCNETLVTQRFQNEGPWYDMSAYVEHYLTLALLRTTIVIFILFIQQSNDKI